MGARGARPARLLCELRDNFVAFLWNYGLAPVNCSDGFLQRSRTIAMEA